VEHRKSHKEGLNMHASRLVIVLILLIAASIVIASTPVNAQVGDFEITASPPHVSIGTDGTAHYVIAVTSVNGFSGSVQLSTSGLSNSGLQATYSSFDPEIVQLAPYGEAFSELTLMTSYQFTGTVPGIETLNFEVIGTGDGLTHSTPLAADLFYGNPSTVQLTGIGLNLQPDTILISGDMTKPQNETLLLTLSSGATTQLGQLLFIASLQAYDVPSGLYISFNPDTVNVVGGQSSQVTVSILMTPQFLQNGGTYKFAIGLNALMQAPLLSEYSTYQNYFISKIAVLTIIIPPSFNIAISPSALNLPIGGGDQQFAIVVTPITNGLTEPIVLSVQGIPSGIITNFQSSTLIPNGVQPLTTSLILDAPSGTWPTSTQIHIQAQAAGATASADALLNVEPQGSYSVQADQTTLQFNGAGQSRSVTLTIVPQGGFKSTIAFAATNLPTGMTATFNTANLTVQQSGPMNVILTLTAGQNIQPGTYEVSITSNTGFSSQSLVLTILVRAGGSEILPVILGLITVIAVVSVILFVGLPSGRTVRRISEKDPNSLPRLPA
jgi:hypothetical protein